ncbi:MAG: protoporphyrinogen oxidase [Ilumatobacteraceae bacterium]
MTTTSMRTSEQRVIVVGGGISGLATAYTIGQQQPAPHVTVLESLPRLGGCISASPFAGLRSVDESADAFLIRSPAALELAREVNLGSELTEPATGHAYIWHRRLHDIPQPTMLGIPANRSAIMNTRLLTTRGKLRASIEPFIPRHEIRLPAENADDCLGSLIRSRFGKEVLERIVDPLVGSIYATDTDHFSLDGMPQIADLARHDGSLMRAAHDVLSARVSGGPMFAAPLRGMSSLIDALVAAIKQQGTDIRISSPVMNIEQTSGGRFMVYTADASFTADAVVLATPARHTASLISPLNSEVAGLLAAAEHASVVMVSLAISRDQWPTHITGSGYLVPKPVQRAVTAVSFGSNKWKHWNPHDKSMILRVSLGRDGVPMHHHDDASLIDMALADLELHLGHQFTPHATRLTRWVEAFPQYRPGHTKRVNRMDAALESCSPGLFLTGASYRGIGIPACVQQARTATNRVFGKLNT